MTRYTVGWFWGPAIELEVPDPPPCLWCGRLVERRSMDGPLVCVPCDRGYHPDGTRLTDEDYEKRAAHARAYLEQYRVKGEAERT
jgi:hypothetical protein